MKKKYLSWIFTLSVMLVCLCLLPTKAQAAEVTHSGTCGQNLTWTLDSEGTLTISGTGAMTDYYYYSSSPWHNIADSIKNVGIANGVTSIGSSAFSGCTNLTSINIPDSVTSIGDFAFSDCTSLTSITLSDSVTSIGMNAFSDCTSLTEVHVFDISAWCQIDFYNTSANPLYHARNLYLNGALVTDVVIPDGTSEIDDHAFQNCASLTSITIPDGVTSIGGSAFSDCTRLTSVTISDSVKTIGEHAFYNCTRLSSVAIGNGVTSIDGGAFYNCTKLEQVHIKDVAAWCGVGLSSGFTPLSALYSNPLYYAKKLYLNGTLVTELVIPDGTTSINFGMFVNCIDLINVTIPDSVTSIGGSVFEGCTSLNEVHISDISAWCQINFYGDNANPLRYAKHLYLNGSLVTDVVVPDGTTKIGSYVFYSYTNLTNITIPDSVTTIGDYAFSWCTGLTSVTIGNSVTTIGDYAFYNCENLAYLLLPKGMDTIDENAFYGCTGLKKVFHKGTQADWDWIIIKWGNDALTNATIVHEYVGDTIAVPGDMDGDLEITRNDVISLLLHVTMPNRFPLNAEADFNGDGQTTRDDVIRLLLHVTMPNRFPLTTTTTVNTLSLAALPTKKTY